jgi:hypothetical protein
MKEKLDKAFGSLAAWLTIAVGIGGAALGVAAFILPYSAHETLVKLFVYVLCLPYMAFWCYKLAGDAIAGFRAGNPAGRQEGYGSTIGCLILLFLVLAGVAHLLNKGF